MFASRKDVAVRFVEQNAVAAGSVVLMSEMHSGHNGRQDEEDQKLNSEIIRAYIQQWRSVGLNPSTFLVEDGYGEMMEMSHTMNRQNEYGIFLQSGHIDIFMSEEVIMSLLRFSEGDTRGAFTMIERLRVICQMFQEEHGISPMSQIFADFDSVRTDAQKVMFMLRMVRKNSQGICFLVQCLKDFSESYRTGNSYANRWFESMLAEINVHSIPTLHRLADQISIVREHYLCEYTMKVSRSFDLVFLIVGHSHWHTVLARMQLESDINNVTMVRAVPLSFYGEVEDDSSDYQQENADILANLMLDDENIEWTDYIKPVQIQNTNKLRF